MRALAVVAFEMLTGRYLFGRTIPIVFGREHPLEPTQPSPFGVRPNMKIRGGI